MQKQPDLKISEVAAELNISERKAWELVRQSELQSYKVGRSRRIPRESLDAYKTRNAVVYSAA